MAVADDLKKVIQGEVDASDRARDIASRDASLFRVVPEVVVRPLGTADIQALVRYAGKNKGVSLTPRAAGTDMSGGPLTASVSVDMLPGFTKILEVGPSELGGFAITQPGVYFRDFDKATKEHGLELPSYTASREICTVGGMAANDSGGEKNLKYGKTARYVEELEVVLADGEVHTLRNLEGEELWKKLKEVSFEGDLYRAVSTLLQENKDTIKERTPVVHKNSSGYALWDIGDGIERLNLARLFVGSQGSLGIITKIRFGLVRPKKFAAMTVLFVKSLEELGSLVPSVLAYQPDSFESYDDNTFRLAVKYFPEFALQMKTGIIGLGFAFLPEVFMLLTGGVPKLVLMAEFRSDSQEEATGRAEKLASDIRMAHKHVQVRVAANEAATRKYWTVRHESFNLLRKKVRGKRTAPFIDDFVVPPLSLPEFMPQLEALLKEYKLTYTIAGHVGDGNFHIIPLIDPKDPTMARVIEELSKKVYDLVLRYHGSISGEHNDGFIRTPFVEAMFGPKMYELFRRVEHIFDPQDIFNPGKKVGTTFASAKTYLDLG
ncbi:MAG: FAD-binding oxidoreductase [Patescibacteria group bacterium]